MFCVPKQAINLLVALIVLQINGYCVHSLKNMDLSSNESTFKRDVSLRTGIRYHLPIATGPYPNVGHIDVMTGTGKKDGVLVRILYPASDQSVDPRVNYRRWPSWHPSDQYKKGYFTSVNITSPVLITMSNIFSTTVFIPTVENVDPLRLDKHQFPVIIFSHGLSSCRTTYSDICYELVSYGFIVFVLEHRDGSACTTFYPNKNDQESFNWVPFKHKKGFPNEFEGRNKQLDKRVADIQRVIDLINDLQKGKQVKNVLNPQIESQKFVGLFDLNNMVVMGHSFGAATAVRATKSIESIKLGICIDAWMFPLEGMDTTLFKKPLLFVNMETFQWTANLETMKKFIENDIKNESFVKRKVFTIKEARHTDPSDFPFILNYLVKRLVKLNSKVDPFVVHDLTTALTLQFIEDILKIKLPKNKNDFIEKYGIHLKEGIEINKN